VTQTVTARRRRSVLWVLLLAAAAGILVFAAVDRSSGPGDNAERASALAGQFACPVCEGQSIAQSDVPIAREIRREIRTRLDQGQTDDQIRQYLVGQYGENIDLRPKATGVTGLVWIIPVVAVVCAVAGLAAVFRRWRREEQRSASDADRVLVERARAAVVTATGHATDASATGRAIDGAAP
jgi:cytochrome c-type biogenesis protein CcmH